MHGHQLKPKLQIWGEFMEWFKGCSSERKCWWGQLVFQGISNTRGEGSCKPDDRRFFFVNREGDLHLSGMYYLSFR